MVVVLTMLFVAGAVVAYQMGKWTKPASQPTNPDAGRTPVPPDDANDLSPGPADKILTPSQAGEREGEVQTVEFKVQSSGGDTNLYLNSDANFKSASNFAVRISSGYFKTGVDAKTLHEKTKQEFDGKTIRARGKIMRDPQNKSLYLDVRSPKQIVVVSDR